MFKIFSTMTLLGLATLSAAYAQSSQPIQAKVPFAFTAQNTTLSAGNYQLTYSNITHRLSLRGLDQNSSAAFATAIPATASGSSIDSARLVFQCYGKSCYLALVWRGSNGGGWGLEGLELPQSDSQRTLAFQTRVVSITIPAK